MRITTLISNQSAYPLRLISASPTSLRAGLLAGTRRIDAPEIVVTEGQNVSHIAAITRHLDLQGRSNGEFRCAS